MLNPSIALPHPWTGAEEGTFARHTVLERFGDIARRTADENAVSEIHSDAVAELTEEIVSGALTLMNAPLAPAAQVWSRSLEPHLGLPWVDAPWFLTETYFYRRLLMALGYWTPGARTLLDPFSSQKRAALAASGELAALLDATQPDIESLLAASLWANRVDLSLWPAGTAEGHAEQRSAEVLGVDMAARLIVDDRAHVEAMLVSGGCLHLVLDNTGAELVSDLALAAAVLTAGGRVVLHAKPHPTFVSDAIPDDVVTTIDRLAASTGIGSRLQVGIESGRIEIDAHPFWVSPHAMWDMPPDLAARLGDADLIVVKGDANYRRLLGDRRWGFTTPFADIVRPPAPLLAVRTLKSEVVAGLPSIDPSEGADPEWLTNGEWGVMQYAPASGSPR